MDTIKAIFAPDEVEAADTALNAISFPQDPFTTYTVADMHMVQGGCLALMVTLA